MATGALDANGIWQYGEDDSETTFSALLNKLGGSTSTTVTRLEEMGGITAAQAETARANLRVGLVPISPSSVVIATGTGSANALGQVSFSGATSVTMENLFSTDFSNYRFVFKIDSITGNADIYLRLRTTSGNETGANYSVVRLNAQGSGTVDVTSGAFDHARITSSHSTSNTGASAAIDILDPFKTVRTRFTYSSNGATTAGVVATYTGVVTHTLSNSYTGLYFYPTSGNFTGTLQVFGYND